MLKEETFQIPLKYIAVTRTTHTNLDMVLESRIDVRQGDGCYGKHFPNFEMLGAKIASALSKIIQNSQFKKKVSLEEQKPRRRTCFYGEDRSLS